MHRKKLSRRSGFALATVLCIVILLLIVGIGTLTLGMHGRSLSVRTSSDIVARAAADAGLTKSIYEMNKLLETRIWDPISLQYEFAAKGLPHASYERLPNCDGLYSYKIVPSSKNGNSEFIVKCVGNSGKSTKTVSAILKVKSIFDSALLVKDRISLMPKSYVGGYNSNDPTDTDINVKIGTTSTVDGRIPLGPGTVVDGDIFVGVGGDPQFVIGAGGTVNGTKFALLNEIDFPVVRPPSLPNIGTSLHAKNSTLTINPADSGIYSDITMDNSKSAGCLEAIGGDILLHITGDIMMGRGCEVVIRPDSSLTIYVDGNIFADNSIGFNNEAGNVEDFALFATGTNQIFNLKAKSAVFGVVYAPHVDIQMYPGSEVYGSIVGRNITFKSGGAFYYDEALQDATIYEEGVLFKVKYWSEE